MILGLSLMDWILLALLVTFGLLGFYKGLIRELFLLVGVFFSVLFAILLMESVGKLLARWLPLSERIQLILGFLSIFILTLILLHLLFYILSRIYRFTPVGLGDRIAGLIFGIGKGGIVIFSILFFIGLLPLTSSISRFFRNSTLMGVTRKFSPKVERIIALIPIAKNVLDTSKGKILIKESEIENEKK